MEREATVRGKGRLDFQAQGKRPRVGEDRPTRSREYSVAAGPWPSFRGPPGPGDVGGYMLCLCSGHLNPPTNGATIIPVDREDSL